MDDTTPMVNTHSRFPKNLNMNQNSSFQEEISYLTHDKDWCECVETLRLQLSMHPNQKTLTPQ